MVERYGWLAEAGPKRDPGCVGRWEIVSALASYCAREAESVFFHALDTFQVERSGNGLEDMAVGLRGQAAAALGDLRPPGALLAISLLLFDIEPKVDSAHQDRPFATVLARRSAARALAALGDPGAVAVLGVRLAHGEGEIAEILVECMDAMVSLDADAGLQTVAPYMNSGNAYLVAGAATALAGLPPSHHHRALELMVQACVEAAPGCREPLALAIASMRCDDAVAALRTMTEHKDVSVRLAGIVGLSQRGGPEAADALKRLPEAETLTVRAAAKEGLARLGL